MPHKGGEILFEKIRAWVRSGVNSIIGTPELLDALGITDPTSTKMRDAINLWAAMHENRAEWINEDVHSLNLAATIASELSRLVTVEMQSVITGSARADFLNGVYQHAIDDARVFTEFAAARGDLILKPYIDGDKLAVGYIKAGDHIPLAFDSNGHSTSELFLDWRVQGDKTFIRAEIQAFTGNTMEITNKVVSIRANDKNYHPASLKDVEEWASVAPFATISNVARPLWGQFKMPFANNIDPSSPLGVSIFSKAAGLIEQADKQYSRLIWEMYAGEMALHVDDTALIPGMHGGQDLPKKRMFVGLNIETKPGEDLLRAWAPTLRDQSIINGLNEILSKIEDTCGLARGTFSDRSEGQAMTATQIKILRQRTYATVTDVQKSLEVALNQLVYALDVWATVGGLTPSGTYEISTQFDDSVITDRTEEYQRLREAVADGTLRAEYLLRELGVQPMKKEELDALRALMPSLARVE